MSLLSSKPWLKRLAAVLITVVSISALTMPSAPANARVFVNFGIGAPTGWGYYAPPPYYGYYGPRYYPYHRAYYGYPWFYGRITAGTIGTAIITGGEL